VAGTALRAWRGTHTHTCLERGRPRSIEERDRGPRLRSSGRAIEQEQCVMSELPLERWQPLATTARRVVIPRLSW
jgi:hypothetical protein